MKTTFVIFWATGDLAKRKLFPALYHIYNLTQSDQLKIVAIGRRPLDNAGFREFIDQETDEFIEKESDFQRFLERVEYQRLELGDGADYEALEAYLRPEIEAGTQIILYLAISPEYFENFIEHYKRINLGNIKVIFEKPFGTDLQSSRELNTKIMEVFTEDQVYRIDHYIGKEAVQNIFDFRFTNTIYEAIWNNTFIDNIQITAAESIGVGDRGDYYDRFGALRDMLQNHLFQVLSLVIMDLPTEINAEGIRREKLKVFRSLNI